MLVCLYRTAVDAHAAGHRGGVWVALRGQKLGSGLAANAVFADADDFVIGMEQCGVISGKLVSRQQQSAGNVRLRVFPGLADIHKF